MSHPRRVVFGVTSHISAYAFLTGQLKYLSSRGWDVHLIVGSDHPGLQEFARSEAVTLHVVPTSRDPEPSDPLFVLRMTRLLRSLRPSICVMATPKMGVFGTVAATFARVPVRIYHTLGARWDGLTGPMRRLIRALDRIACGAATDVVALSRSLEARLLEQRVVSPAKVQVLGDTSIGVDLGRFSPADDARRRDLREEFGIPPSARVVTFVARLTRDKGVHDLPSIWAGVVKNVPEAWLLVVGDPEPNEPVDGLKGLTRASIHGHTGEVEKVFQLADLNLSLSRREGLGMVPLEAARCGVPTAAFAVTGIVDSVEDGRTGRLVPLGDTTQLVAEITHLLSTPADLEELGRRAQERVTQRFGAEDAWQRWAELLESRSEGRAARPR